MNNKISCKKVSSMLSVYIDNKVTEAERAFIEEHLSNCENCHNKYVYLKSLIKNLKDSYKQIMESAIQKQKQKTFSIREHEKFLENLSPYVDNELNTQECYEFRKYLTKSKTAQKELRNTYILQKELKNSYNKIRKKMSIGMSYRIINAIKTSNKIQGNSFIHKRFTYKSTKIAILAGLVLFGSYGLIQIENIYKAKTHKFKQESKIEVTSQNTEKPTQDFIEF